MELQEIYVQGVSRFLTPFKFAAGKGYNVIYGGNESGKSALAQAIVAAFDGAFAATAGARLQPIVSQPAAGRYGVVFGHKNQKYRLLRDTAGGINLSCMNPETQKFEPVARNEPTLVTFLQDELDFPPDGLFALLGLTDRNLSPAGSASAVTSYAPVAAGSYDEQMGYGDDAPAEESAGDIEAQLKQLRREHSVLGSIGQLEYQLDGLQKKRFETEAKAAKFKEFTRKLEEDSKRIKEIEPISVVTPELESRIKNLERQEEFQRQKLMQLDADVAALEKRLDFLEPRHSKKFHKDPLFIAGAGVALLGFILPFFTNEFLVIFGFAGAGWLGYLFVLVYPKIATELTEVNKKYKSRLAEEEKLKKEFEAQTSIIHGLVKTLKVLDAKDLVELAVEYRELVKKQADINAARNALAAEVGDENRLQGDLQRQDAEIALFEEELRNAGAITRDLNQIDAEIKRLEAIKANGGQGAPAHVAGASTVSIGTVPQVTGGGNALALLEAAARLTRRELTDVVESVGEKFTTYLRALSNGKLGPATIHESGAIDVVRAEAGDTPSGLDCLSEGGRATVWLALRLGLLEAIMPTRPFPVIFDDPFAILDDQRQAVAAKALKRLAGFTQVIHFTSQKSFLALADAKAEIK